MSVFRNRSASPSLDPATAERLLAGEPLDPQAAPEIDAVARLLASASGPASDAELAGEAAAVAAFVQVTGGSAPAPTARRRKLMPASALRSKAAIAIAAAAASLGGFAAAAYANALPAPAQDAAHHLIGASAAHSHPTPRTDDDATDSAPTAATPTATPVGPDATGSAMFGLCTAYAAASVHGNPLNGVAFQNLAAAAGGAENIPAFCATVLTPPSSTAPENAPNTTHPTGPPSTVTPGGGATHAPTTHPTGGPSDHPTGPPATHPAAPTGHPTPTQATGH
jgi:hypothetical protein